MLRWIEGGGNGDALRDPGLIGFPLHIGDLTLRSDVRLGVAVALEAPLHRDRLDDPDRLHLVDAAVTRCAADARA